MRKKWKGVEELIDTFSLFLSQIQVGEFESLRDLSLAPIFGVDDPDPGLNYLTLDEAMEKGLLKIREKEEGAEVSELLAENLGDLPVLILDGEELIGAKQNRTLNTTILLKEKSKTIIPVSCTEAGRWHHKSTFFAKSEFFVSSRIREEKVKTVTQSLKEKRGFRSNQGGIWGRIDQIAWETGFRPETGAFRDIASRQIQEIKDHLEGFLPKQGQTGFMVKIRGKIVGMEFLSSPRAFSKLCHRILGGFAFDSLFNLTNGIFRIYSRKSFLDQIKKSKVEIFNSVGYGKDLRLWGEKIVGSSLIYNGLVIHGVFFTKSEDRGVFRTPYFVDYSLGR
ncbi:MAG: hypothetical protein NUV68_01370 [Caldiserica bacterium]|jgi:hypothetical protein|nr:hypothetical protein [Caldisericota bacterium]MDH7562007.1 hypothetical protein [Caldisericota bacterium]